MFGEGAKQGLAFLRQGGTCVALHGNHGASDFRWWPEAAGLDIAHDLHIVIGLNPNRRRTTFGRGGLGGKAFGYFKLDQRNQSFGRVGLANQIHQDAGANRIGEVGGEGLEALR